MKIFCSGLCTAPNLHIYRKPVLPVTDLITLISEMTIVDFLGFHDREI